MTHGDLVRLAAHLGTGSHSHDSRQQLLNAIASHVSEGDLAFVERVCKADQSDKKTGAETLLMDPVFEAAYEEMPEEDKFEFPELRQEVRRGRVRRHIADRREQAVRRAAAVEGRRPLNPRNVRPRRRANSAQGVVPVPDGGLVPQPLPQQGEQGVVQLPGPLAPGGPLPDGGLVPQPLQQLDPPHPAPQIAVLPLQAPADLGPAVPAPVLVPVAAGAAGARVPRGELWGRGRFVLARAYRHGQLQSVTVTCLLHTHADRCNNNLSLGVEFSEADCLARIKEWCVRGFAIPDGIGARDVHMASNPRRYVGAHRSHAELDMLANA